MGAWVVSDAAVVEQTRSEARSNAPLTFARMALEVGLRQGHRGKDSGFGRPYTSSWHSQCIVTGILSVRSRDST